MSFGWSAGDVIAGITIVWNIWNAVSDGPLNATVEATQFFEEFSRIIGCLEDWDKRKDDSKITSGLAASHAALRDQCTKFIKKHMRLIQNANPKTQATRAGRSTWLKQAPFSRDQVLSLYQHVEWPLERNEVKRLREKLQLYLQLATYDVVASTHDMAANTNHLVQDLHSRNSELLSTNMRLVSSHLDLVSLITLNLKRITYPLEPQSQLDELDYPMLRQFQQALLPPQPLRMIEARSQNDISPWRDQPLHQSNSGFAMSALGATSSSISAYNANDQMILSQRLENLSMRRVETIDSVVSSTPSQSSVASVVPLIDRLRDMRNHIGDTVGIPNPDLPVSHSTGGAQDILQLELEAWNLLGERIEREILHPPGDRFSHPSVAESSENSVPMSRSSTRESASQSPLSSSPPQPGYFAAVPQGSDVNHGLHSFQPALSSSPPQPAHSDSVSRSPDSNHGFHPIRPLSQHPLHRLSSTGSSSIRASSPLATSIAVTLTYSNEIQKAQIYSISRFENGEVQSITSHSADGLVEIRHSVDPSRPAPMSTSMKPFLDNTHVDKHHRFRIQFQGSHSLKITRWDTQKTYRYHVPPIYTFTNVKDFISFQNALLGKEVECWKNVQRIKSKEKDVQCLLSTLRVLCDPVTRERSILYFRKSKDLKPDFVEWPITAFKPPGEPKHSRILTLESRDGRSLSFSNTSPSFARRGTQGSISSDISLDPNPASPNPVAPVEKPGRSMKGLVIEFHESSDCLDFWQAFVKKEGSVSGTDST
ncbi:hypothetical protein BP5796_06645 [Coleophoma crateriformis]|uniref:Uncharacterized protein n=1 Tax=Coleophoma crateriformis TaxID=565419 RepID=A0A3D8RPL9_9HELO|nr:hypothetical protein BP5796_06645 [Coleophoma crateriformis]